MSLLDNYLYNCARTFVMHVSSVLILLFFISCFFFFFFFEAQKGVVGRSVA